MNKKLTKLLSVFIIAGAIGTGSAFGLAGCGHKHSAASEWQSDETNHWHDCTDNDGEKLDVGAHEYDNEQDATCNVCGHERQVTIAVTGVSLDQTAVTLKLGATVTATLVATVAPSNASNKQVSWSSSDETVATVANGVVTALKEGTATITVTTADGSRTATCTITVQAADVTPEPETPTITGVTASASKTEATVNDTITLTATVSGTGEYNQNVTWAITEGSDKATLEGNTLTVTGAGTVKVQATAVGDTTKKSEEITITVTAATVTPDPDPTPETYTVTWKNGETELEKDTNVAKDATPSYDGATPTKVATAQYTYTFNGWTDGTNTYGLTDELPAVTGDVTYTAVFAETVNKYTVTWKNGEETLATAQVEYGTVPTFTGAEPTKAATAQYTYTFAGWNEEVVAVTGEATYTAKFTETVNKYTVTWKNYDGTVLETDAEVPYGTVPTYDRENPTKVEDGKNFAFSGWDKEVVAVTGDVEYTAQFTELQSGQYSVTFNMNGHGAAIADGVTTDGKITAPTAPTADGYTFGGWFETAACDGTAIDFATKEFTANATVYAKWTATEYTVTFKADGVQVGDVQKYTIENKEITVPTVPAKTGYNGAWTAYDLDVLENKTVQAVYTAIEYTITYNLDGGTNAQDPATTYTIESEDITLAAPTKDGYRFDGWYNADNEKVVTIAKGSTGDITLTAKWVEQVTLTVTDKSGATVGSSAFDKGATVTLEELDELTTAPAGYAVWKVYTDFNAGTEYTAGEITADTTLVATFVLTEEGYKAALNATIALKNVTVKMGEGTPNTVFAADGTKVLNAFDAVYRVYSADGYDEYVNVNGEWYKRTVASTVDGYQDYDAYVYEVMSEYILLGEFINMYSQGTYDDKNDEYVISIQNGAELGAEFKLTISDGKVTTMAASTQTGTQVVSITEVSDTITLPEAKEYTKFLELSTQPNNVISEDFSDYEENYRLTDTANKYGIYADKASEIENFSVTNGKLTQTTNGANFGLTIPFGITNGDVEGYFEVSVNDTGSKWKLLQFSTVSSPALIIGTSDSDKTKLSYSVNGGTYTATNIAFSANTLYKVHFVYTSGGVLSVDINGVEIVSNVDIGTGVDRVYLVSGSSGARKLTLDNIAVCANQITAGEYYETAIAALNAKYSAEYILADTVDGEGNPVKATHSINAERVTSIYDMYTNATDGVLLVYAPEGECADYSVQELICRIDEMFVQLQEIDTDEAVLAAREVAKQAVQNYYNEIKSNYTEREAELSSRLDIEFEVINNMTSVNDIERYTNGETRSIYDEETGVWIENVYYTAEQVLAEIFEGVENDTTVWTEELNSAKAQAEIDLSAAGLDSIPNYTALMAKKDNGATAAESAAITAIEGIIANANTAIAAVEVGEDGATTVADIVTQAKADIAAEIAKSSEDIETVKTTAKATLADYAQAEIDKLDAETDATLIAAIETAVSNGNAAIDDIVVSGEVDFATASANVETALTNAMLAIDKLVAKDEVAKYAEEQVGTRENATLTESINGAITNANNAIDAATNSNEATDANSIKKAVADAKANIDDIIVAFDLSEYKALKLTEWGIFLTESLADVATKDETFANEIKDGATAPDFTECNDNNAVDAALATAKESFITYRDEKIAAKTYTVTVNGLDSACELTVKYGSKVVVPDEKLAADKMIKKLYTDSEKTQVFDTETEVYSDLVLYAEVVEAIVMPAVTNTFNYSELATAGAVEKELLTQEHFNTKSNSFITIGSNVAYRPDQKSCIQAVKNTVAFSVEFTAPGTLTLGVRGTGKDQATEFYLVDKDNVKAEATYDCTNCTAVDKVYKMYSSNFETFTFKVPKAGTYSFVVSSDSQYDCRINSIVQTINSYKVAKVAVNTVTINGATEIIVGENSSINLTTTIDPGNASLKDNVAWSVDDENKATINDGVLTLKAGAAVDDVITVTATVDGKSDTHTVKVKAQPVETVKVSVKDGAAAKVEEAGTLQLVATITPDNATYKTVTWSVDKTDIATINSETGELRGVAAGTVTVTATADGVSGTIEIEVLAPVAAERVDIKDANGNELTLVDGNLVLDDGDTLQLSAVVSPDNATNKNVTWSVNSDCVSVTQDGLVTAVSPTGDGVLATVQVMVSNSDIKATLNVKVNKVAVDSVTKASDCPEKVTVGETVTLKADVKSAIEGKTPSETTVTWEITNNAELATINASTGELTAGSTTGTVTVKATSTDDTTKSVSFDVTINKPTVYDTELLTLTAKDSSTADGVITVKAGSYDVKDGTHVANASYSKALRANGDTRYIEVVVQAGQTVKVLFGGNLGSKNSTSTLYFADKDGNKIDGTEVSATNSAYQANGELTYTFATAGTYRIVCISKPCIYAIMIAG